MISIKSDEINLAEFELYVKKPIPIHAKEMKEDFEVVTLEGTMKGKLGDYLMVGIRGEVYPCERGIFIESYEHTTK